MPLEKRKPMLRITQSESSDAAKKYFGQSLRRGDYYLEGQEIAGNWGGRAAKMLHLDGPVKEKVFGKLLENIRPDGRRLTIRTVENRRPGYDFTFDVPKSVSLLHALGGDERIAGPQRAQPWRKRLVEIEQEMHTRVRFDGAQNDRRTGNMVWADFTHFTSRPAPVNDAMADRLKDTVRQGDDGKALLPDPHLHFHVYVLNATYDPEERRFKAGVFMQAKRDALYFQAAYHNPVGGGDFRSSATTSFRTANAFEIVGVPVRTQSVSFHAGLRKSRNWRKSWALPMWTQRQSSAQRRGMQKITTLIVPRFAARGKQWPGARMSVGCKLRVEGTEQLPRLRNRRHGEGP
jgi:hypothetical protein